MGTNGATHALVILGVVCFATSSCAPAPAPQSAGVAPPVAEAAPPTADATPPPENPTEETSPTEELKGGEFLLVSAEGHVPVPDVPIQLAFMDGSLMFFAGCNRHGGSYHVCGSQLCLDGLMATKRGCPPELMAQDEWLAAFLNGKPEVALRGGKLTLSGEGVTLEFLAREKADPDRPLTGRSWTITTFLDDLGQWSFALQAPPTVEFLDDGSFRVSSSCLTGQGRYVAKEQTLTLSQVNYRDNICPTDNDQKARRFLRDVLSDGEVEFAIRAARLMLARGKLGLAGSTQ